MLQAAITIDLDSLYCYQRLYGLPVDEMDNIVYEAGLERFVNLMEEYELRGTLFVVGRDLGMGDNARVLSYLAERGFEIANHTLNHNYRLTRMSVDDMRYEVGQGKRAIEDATGWPVVGFRAPGYNMNRQLLSILAETGHTYDTSVFPSAPYYMTKAGVLAAYELIGRQSHSILGGPEVLAAPLGPYRPSRQFYWRRGDMPLWEFPISTSPVLRLPLLGSFLVMMGERRFPALYAMMKHSSPCLVLEFHGVDFLDARWDGLDEELMRQPDLAVDWPTKERLYRRILETLCAEHRVTPLREALAGLEA